MLRVGYGLPLTVKIQLPKLVWFFVYFKLLNKRQAKNVGWPRRPQGTLRPVVVVLFESIGKRSKHEKHINTERKNKSLTIKCLWCRSTVLPFQLQKVTIARFHTYRNWSIVRALFQYDLDPFNQLTLSLGNGRVSTPAIYLRIHCYAPVWGRMHLMATHFFYPKNTKYSVIHLPRRE